jgi:hypothetical protein
MATSNKKSLAEKLNQWAKLAQRQKQIQERRDSDLQPFKEEYERSCASIVEAAEQKLLPIQQELTALASEIETALKAGAKPDGTVKIPQLVGDAAIATVKPTAVREIPAQDFLNAIPAPERTSEFWSCLKVLLGETTKVIGANRVEALANKSYTYKVEIRLK